MALLRLWSSDNATKTAARKLCDAAVAQSRSPALYRSLGVGDTPEGRFEALTLHVLLVLDRLALDGDRAASLRQQVFDTYIGDLDGALREMGVGDLSVGKRMRKLGEAFYGRGEALASAFARLPDETPLRAVVARTLLEETGGGDAAGLAGYARRCRAELAAQATDDLAGGSVHWPQP